jgi:hypothetical protein
MNLNSMMNRHPEFLGKFCQRLPLEMSLACHWHMVQGRFIYEHMERFTVGQCRTGKIITSQPDLDGLASYEEIFDAMAALSLLAVLERRRERRGKLAEELDIQSNNLVNRLKKAKQWDRQMQLIGARTAFDIRRYAWSLLCSSFKV